MKVIANLSGYLRKHKHFSVVTQSSQVLQLMAVMLLAEGGQGLLVTDSLSLLARLWLVSL
jgi:hypothetical protein